MRTYVFVSRLTRQSAEILHADLDGLPITVGTARTKFLAKVAGQEARPDGLKPSPTSPSSASRCWPRWWAAGLYALSHNVDPRRVTTGVRRHSVGAQRALGRTGITMSAAEIDAVVDQVRRRYGRSALTRGALVGRDPGLEMPHLPN